MFAKKATKKNIRVKFLCDARLAIGLLCFCPGLLRFCLMQPSLDLGIGSARFVGFTPCAACHEHHRQQYPGDQQSIC
jgi:hypothetical protein